MDKKAQLSMETIMIYGAVILVVTLAIGALMYFGVLDLGALLPDKCNTGNKITCDMYSLKSVGASSNPIQIEFINRVGKNIEIQKIEFNGLEDWTGTYAVADYSASPQTVNNGQKFEIGTVGKPWDSTTDLGGRTGKLKAEIKITYNVIGSALQQQEKGQILAKIQE